MDKKLLDKLRIDENSKGVIHGVKEVKILLSIIHPDVILKKFEMPSEVLNLVLMKKFSYNLN